MQVALLAHHYPRGHFYGCGVTAECTKRKGQRNDIQIRERIPHRIGPEHNVSMHTPTKIIPNTTALEKNYICKSRECARAGSASVKIIVATIDLRCQKLPRNLQQVTLMNSYISRCLHHTTFWSLARLVISVPL